MFHCNFEYILLESDRSCNTQEESFPNMYVFLSIVTVKLAIANKNSNASNSSMCILHKLKKISIVCIKLDRIRMGKYDGKLAQM